MFRPILRRCSPEKDLGSRRCYVLIEGVRDRLLRPHPPALIPRLLGFGWPQDLFGFGSDPFAAASKPRPRDAPTALAHRGARSEQTSGPSGVVCERESR